MLAQGQEAISQHFAGQGPTEPELLFEHMAGVPVLANVCAALAAEVEARHDCGDHSLFIGRVLGLRDDDRLPLVFHGGKYATLHYKTPRRRKRRSTSGNWTTTRTGGATLGNLSRSRHPEVLACTMRGASLEASRDSRGPFEAPLLLAPQDDER